MQDQKTDFRIEGGFVRIPNDLLEVMIDSPFSASEFKIMWIVIRKTYGWNKENDLIPFSQFARFANLNLRYVKKIVSGLVRKNVLLKEKSRDGNIFRLNKSYHCWRLWKTQSLINRVVPNLTPEEVVFKTPQTVIK